MASALNDVRPIDRQNVKLFQVKATVNGSLAIPITEFPGAKAILGGILAPVNDTAVKAAQQLSGAVVEAADGQSCTLYTYDAAGAASTVDNECVAWVFCAI